MLEFTEKGLFLNGKKLDEKMIADSAKKIRAEQNKDVGFIFDDPKKDVDKELVNSAWDDVIKKPIKSKFSNVGHIIIEAVDENGNYGLIDVMDKK